MPNYHLKQVEDIPDFLEAEIAQVEYLSLPLWQRWYYECDIRTDLISGTTLDQELENNPGWQPA